MKNPEHWIWTELMGFDNTKTDLGVSEYLENAGFVPKGICIMMTTPDFVLAHAGNNRSRRSPVSDGRMAAHPRQPRTNLLVRGQRVCSHGPGTLRSSSRQGRLRRWLDKRL